MVDLTHGGEARPGKYTGLWPSVTVQGTTHVEWAVIIEVPFVVGA